MWMPTSRPASAGTRWCAQQRKHCKQGAAARMHRAEEGVYGRHRHNPTRMIRVAIACPSAGQAWSTLAALYHSGFWERATKHRREPGDQLSRSLATSRGRGGESGACNWRSKGRQAGRQAGSALGPPHLVQGVAGPAPDAGACRSILVKRRYWALGLLTTCVGGGVQAGSKQVSSHERRAGNRAALSRIRVSSSTGLRPSETLVR